MPRYHPCQKVCVLPLQTGKDHLLLAASGPTINCISFPSGKLLHQWPTQCEASSEDDDDIDGDTRPIKRRKVDSNGHGQVSSSQQSEVSDVSIEIVSERKKGERKKSKFLDTKSPNVSHLLAMADGKHVVAVTAEDKAIRVFKISAAGKLQQLSQRSLPKKLCAVQITKDGSSILAADKFGDVYAVPLHQSESWTPRPKQKTDVVFKPAATATTVHTKRNKLALKHQLLQKDTKARKEGPDFEHKLLLGHVSLLTDVEVAEGVVDGKRRPFILTSDRDEHIRVSRGMPQAHVIENYCLGHHEFVTRLCIAPSRPELLIAGSGEMVLKVFEWQSGMHRQDVMLEANGTSEAISTIDKAPSEPLMAPDGREKLVVSGMWPVEFARTTKAPGDGLSLILVAIEGLPTLLTYILKSDSLESAQSIHCHGNVLDVAVLESTQQILVSIDTVHKPSSTKSYREGNSSPADPFQLFELHTSDTMTGDINISWESVKLPFDCSDIIQALPEAPGLDVEEETKLKAGEKIFSGLGDFLYGLENLRKKRDFTAEELGLAEMDGDALLLEEPEET